jgi:phage protein D
MTIAAPGWQILYGGTNITGNLQPHATHIEYHEAISGKTSSLQIYLEDAAKAFQNHPPQPGAAVSLQLGYAGSTLVNCGLFEVDEWEFNGPPDLFVLRCIQAGITHALRTPKSVAYENQSLISIANTIAARYGMTVVADAVMPNVTYARVTQKLESDLAFLHRISNLHNYDFNVRGNQLVFYSRPQLEALPSVGTIEKTNAMRFHLRKQHVGERSYKSAIAVYFNPLSKQLVQALANDPNATSTDTLKIVERMENNQQATLRAQSHLHVSNMQQIKGQIDMPGTMLYRAGNPVMLSGFGAFDGVKFIVEEGHHQITRRGYRTMLHLRTTVSGTASQVISDEYED